jgi:hypothetical protein
VGSPGFRERVRELFELQALFFLTLVSHLFLVLTFLLVMHLARGAEIRFEGSPKAPCPDVSQAPDSLDNNRVAKPRRDEKRRHGKARRYYRH